MNYQKFIRGILPFYVAIGPVYWFIAISPNLFNLVKYIIAIIVIISPLIFTTHTYYLKPGIIKQSGVVLIIGIIVLSMPSVLVNQSSEGVVIISRYFILLGLLLGFYWTLTYRHVYDKLPLVMSLVLSFLCLITIYDWLFGGNLYSFDHQMRLYKVGFSTTRTGWSSGLGCCAVFLMWQFLISVNKQRYLYLFAFVCIVFSQLASGGRGGLLASLVGALGLCIYYRKFHYLLILAFFGSLFALNNQEMLTHHLRIDRLSAGSNADFSSGRFSHYTHALEVVNSIGDILFGLGPKGYKDYFIELAISNEIHNVWIRLLVEYGIFLPLFILLYLGYSMLNFYLNNRYKKKNIGVLFVLISGLIPTMVEPNAIIFSYQNYLIWWLLFVCIKMNTAGNFVKNYK